MIAETVNEVTPALERFLPDWSKHSASSQKSKRAAWYGSVRADGRFSNKKIGLQKF
jgi:hypothetical protein